MAGVGEFENHCAPVGGRAVAPQEPLGFEAIDESRRSRSVGPQRRGELFRASLAVGEVDQQGGLLRCHIVRRELPVEQFRQPAGGVVQQGGGPQNGGMFHANRIDV